MAIMPSHVPVNPGPETELRVLASLIRAEHTLCVEAACNSLLHARECGRHLWAAKDRVPEGRWTAWLAESFSFTRMTAWRYMRIEEESRPGGRLAGVENGSMGSTQALALLAPPDAPDPFEGWPDAPANARGAANDPPAEPAIPDRGPFDQGEPLPSGEAPDQDAPPADADCLRDPAGLVIPDRLLAVFALSAVWDEAELRLRQAVALLEKLESEPGGDELRDREVLRGVRDELADFPYSRPFASACAFCQPASHDLPRPDCIHCYGRGWLARPHWEVAPAAARARLLTPPTED